MLKLTLEAEIFLDFINTQPKQFPEGSLEEHSYWNAFFTFIKSGANLDLINNNKLDNSIFLIGLSTGRKGTKINIIENFNKPHKYKLPKETPFENIYFLNETSREQGEKYRSVNSFAFGFDLEIQRKKFRWVTERRLRICEINCPRLYCCASESESGGAANACDDGRGKTKEDEIIAMLISN